MISNLNIKYTNIMEIWDLLRFVVSRKMLSQYSFTEDAQRLAQSKPQFYIFMKTLQKDIWNI